jgi:hypothetical protein
MSMIYLANVPSIASDKCINFYTNDGHVAVDYPSDEQPNYIVWSFKSHRDTLFVDNFADAMDIAVDLLKLSELRANKFYI